MTRRFFDLAFTPAVRAAQNRNGSGEAYGRLPPSDGAPDELTEIEAVFIALRDSFYMATVNEDGWPYVQHRGGPPGFVKVLGPSSIGIADYRGNRQYVSVGNLKGDSRASLLFMDYPNRRRLKMLARAREIGLADAPDLIARLSDPAYGAKIERGLVFEIEAFDWNCPQHITPRYTEAEFNNLR